MKRIWGAMLALVLCASAAAGLANGWGLSGELLSQVMRVHTWDDYARIGNQAGPFAVLGGRYHNVLLHAGETGLESYATAVYPPGEAKADDVTLRLDGTRLEIAYGADEWYAFDDMGYGYALVGAQVGDFHVQSVDENDGWTRMRTWDSTGEAYWQGAPRLRGFAISLFPRSVADVRHLNEMRAALASGERLIDEKTERQRKSALGSGTAAVYSAPDEGAWRAAKGKAAVGLAGELWRICTLQGDGGVYTMIRYDVSERTQRIGFVREDELGFASTQETLEYNAGKVIDVPLIARRGTFLTDDPDVSQFAQLYIVQGTRMRCLAIYGPYAYVDATGIAGEQAVWGFVPLLDVALDAQHRQPMDAGTDVMQRMAGSWTLTAGGSMANGVLVFHADGTYEAQDPAGGGTYAVTAYDPASNLYWNDPPYELTLREDDGQVIVTGMTLSVDDDGLEWISLTNWEGGGGYTRTGSAVDF